MASQPDQPPTVTPRHHRVAADAWDDIYVIGDVHGCRSALEELLTRLAPARDDLVVFVGDLVCKGPDSAGVVGIVRSNSNMLSVRGNNEQRVIEGEIDVGLDSDARAYLRSMPVAVSFAGTLVVHAGVDPRLPVAEQDRETLQTIRSVGGGGAGAAHPEEPWFERYVGPPRVCFGHTVVDAPVDREWAVGVDTGCVYGGELTAYDVRRDRFVSVSADGGAVESVSPRTSSRRPDAGAQ